MEVGVNWKRERNKAAKAIIMPPPTPALLFVVCLVLFFSPRSLSLSSKAGLLVSEFDSFRKIWQERRKRRERFPPRRDIEFAKQRRATQRNTRTRAPVSLLKDVLYGHLLLLLKLD